MVRKINVKDVSFREFRKYSKFFIPNESKVLVKDGKIIAKYSSKTKRVTIKK